MSRDYTPEESYASSFLIAENFDEYLEKLCGWYIVYNDERKPLYTEKQKQKIKKYPYTTRTNVEMIINLPAKACKYLENCIKEMITNNDVIDETIKLWFYGKLDKTFYYSDENNRLLKDYLLEKFNTKNKEAD